MSIVFIVRLAAQRRRSGQGSQRQRVRNWTVTAGATIVAGCFRSRWLLKLRIRHQQAQEGERTEKHAGLYWFDAPNDKGENVRLFLPNYFNTFREQLKRDPGYSNLIGNRGTILELLGRHDEARQHFDEATEFQP